MTKPGRKTTPTPVESLSRRGMETRRRLVEAARHVFERDGFVNARIADIADDAGTAHGSFYNYFDSKEAIFRAVADEVVEEVYFSTYAGHEGVTDPVALLSLANERHYEAWVANGHILVTMDQVAEIWPEFHERLFSLRRQFIERYTRTLRKLQDDGLAYADLDPYHTACALSAMTEHSIRWWVGRGEKHDRQKAIDTLNALWARAIGLEKPPPTSP
jgi:AcrR family transcriptional regulator